MERIDRSIEGYGKGTGKYGNTSQHHPRCACGDCNAMFVKHNREWHCQCASCASHREIGADLPPMTSVATIPLGTDKTITVQLPVKRKETSVSTLHMCERKGCEAIIQGRAITVVQVSYNPQDNNRTEENRETMTLCPGCAEDVATVLHTLPVTPREKGYSKPYPGWSDKDDFAQDDAVAMASDDMLLAELMRRRMLTQKGENDGK